MRDDEYDFEDDTREILFGLLEVCSHGSKENQLMATKPKTKKMAKPKAAAKAGGTKKSTKA